MEKTVLVTGASSGVGMSLARYLSKNGYSVIAAARRFEKMEEDFADDKDISIQYLDLNDVKYIPVFVKSLIEKYEYIPYLINNAGVNINQYVNKIKYVDLIQSFNINSFSPLLVMQELIEQMKNKNFGRIINITSGAPLNCFKGFGCYSASKSALNALTVTAAHEYSKYNIKINLMSPGPVKSEMAPNAPMDSSVCFPTMDYLLNLDDNGPTGKFFWLGYEIPLFPDLHGVEWLKGQGNNKLKRIL